MKNSRRYLFLFAIISLFVVTLSCRLTEDRSVEENEAPEEPIPTVTPSPIFPQEPLTIDEPGGAALTVDAGALSEDVEVVIEEIGEGVPFGSGSPFTSASQEYMVDLGDAQQVGSILMTVPLNSGGKQAAVKSSYVYLAWTEPTSGTPSVVGVHVEEDMATFPDVGPGKYQVYKLIAHAALMEMVSIYDPLAVPTYQQRTPAWCSPTAMTNIVNYYQGSWPVGGFGAVWGESSNWYLAGKAGQPFNSGYFFHWLLGAGGYNVPSNVKQSFSDGNVEVIIWNWKASVNVNINPQNWTVELYTDYAFANALFDAYQAYVESFVWGVSEPRRPVAWGSSLAAHSRTITGSNGTEFYFNNPSSGSLNDTGTWADYRQTVMDSLTAEKTEVIDTVVFHAEPRPAAARRGVIWLFPNKDGSSPGSVVLIAGDSGQPATKWQWDGSMGHEQGYYHEDQRGILPTDPVFDSQFKAMDYNDEVEYGFAVKNIAKVTYPYHVDVVLQNENLSVLENVGKFDFSVNPGQRKNFIPADSFRLYELPPGLFTLKFVLLQNGVYQDVKYVQFRVAKSDIMYIDPHVLLTQNAFCRKGPDPVFADVTAYEAGTELSLLGVNPERTWAKVEKTINDIVVRCWISLSTVELIGGDNAAIIVGPPLPVEPVEPVCTSTLDRAACEEAGGTYFLGAAEATCLCPE